MQFDYRFLWVFSLCFWQFCLSQSGVQLKDIHHSNVTDAIILEGRGEVYTSDASGKILFYDLQTGDYKGRLKNADNTFINYMYSLNDSTLVAVKKYTINDKSIDSLFFYDLSGKQLFKKVDFPNHIIRKRNEDFVAVASQMLVGKNSMAIMQAQPFQQLSAFGTSKQVTEASFSPDGKQLAFIQSTGINGYNELVLSDFQGNIIHQIPLAEGMAKYHLLFESPESFLLFSKVQSSSKEVTIQRFKTTDFSFSEVYKLNVNNTDWRLEVSENGDRWVYFPVDQYGPSIAIYGKKKGDKYFIDDCEINQLVKYMSPLAGDKLLVLGSTYLNRSDVISHYAYDLKSGKLRSKGRPMSYGDNKAYFLGNGDYLISEYRSFNSNLRYFPATTLQNKYGKLQFDDWLELNKNIRFAENYIHSYQIDVKTNNVAFKAEINGELRAISYNLETDNYDYLSPAVRGMEHIAGFDSSTNTSIILNQTFSEAEYPSLRTIKVCTSGECESLSGEYRDVVMSDDGKFIATISSDLKFELRTTRDLKVSYTEQLSENNRYKIISTLESGFGLNVAPPFNYNKCTVYMNFYSFTENEQWLVEKQECFKMSVFDFKNDLAAIYVEQVGIVLGDNIIPLELGNKITQLSLSPDKKKLLSSFEDGTISFYEVATNELLAQWILTSAQDQLIVGKSGKFLANFDAADYLVLSKTNSESIGSFENPEAVLNDIGKLDDKLIAALRKAENAVSGKSGRSKSLATISKVYLNGDNVFETDVLKNRLSFKTSLPLDRIQVKINNVPFPSLSNTKMEGLYRLDFEVSAAQNYISIIDKESNAILFEQNVFYNGSELNPELHVLAIGVSRYEQEENNLTFADKDALDLTRFYGDIPDQDIQNYYDTFYAKPLYLKDINDKSVLSKINYFPFNIYGIDLKYAGDNGRFWYAYDSSTEKTLLYDFKQGGVTEMKLPPPEEIEDINYNAATIEKYDGSGFYFITSQGWQFYSFTDNDFKSAVMPFSDTDYMSRELVQLDNGHWIDAIIDYDGLSNVLNVEVFSATGNLKNSYFIDNDSSLSYLATSKNGRFFLFKDYLNGLYLYQIDGSRLKLLSSVQNFEIESLTQFHINSDEEQIFLYRDTYRDDDRLFMYQKLDFQFNEVSKKEILIDSESTLSVVFDQGEVLKLQQGKPLADTSFISFMSREDAFAKARSTTSFTNTNVKYLLNEEATQERILNELSQLSSALKPQDQLIVFFAGHGVLDDDLNYYYAPQDMDFEAVKQKGVAFDNIIEAMIDSGSRRLLLLMDTCHSGNTLDMDNYEITKEKGENGERGGVSRRTKGEESDIKVSDVVATLFNNSTSTSGVTVLSASSGQDVAYEARNLSNGAFTTAFINQLKSDLGGLYSVDADYSNSVELNPDFIDELRVSILQLTNNKQEMDIRERNKKAVIKLW